MRRTRVSPAKLSNTTRCRPVTDARIDNLACCLPDKQPHSTMSPCGVHGERGLGEKETIGRRAGDRHVLVDGLETLDDSGAGVRVVLLVRPLRMKQSRRCA